ncbi:MAG: hypothetical protein U0R52_11805 [Solirubrobacterales bacterium]
MRGLRAARAATHRPAGPPLFAPGRLFGVRGWRIVKREQGALRLGGYRAEPWQADGRSTWARCIAGSGHPGGEAAPAGGCTCGLYAMHPWAIGDEWPWADLAASGPAAELGAIGIVEAWGKVQVHREGFRAQYARPVRLALVGVGRDTAYGRLVEDLAIAHRTGLLEFGDRDRLQAHCEAEGMGIAPETAESLIGEADPGAARVDRSG